MLKKVEGPFHALLRPLPFCRPEPRDEGSSLSPHYLYFSLDLSSLSILIGRFDTVYDIHSSTVNILSKKVTSLPFQCKEPAYFGCRASHYTSSTHPTKNIGPKYLSPSHRPMSKPNSKLPPVIHYGTAHPDPNPPPSQPTDSTMLLASVSEQYGSSIPPSRFAKNKGENKTAVAPPPAAAAPAPTVDTKTAKHGSLPMFLTSEYSDII